MFLRHKPKLKYIGLTVILSNPSRLDRVALLTGPAGHVLNDYCLRPSNNSMQCDIRLVDDPSPLLPDTKCIIVLGEAGMHKMIPDSRRNTLNEMRGSVFMYNGIPIIPSFYPQDCCDTYENLERKLNPLNASHASFSSGDEDGDEDDDDGDAKSLSPTSRKNFAFWLKADISKCKKIIANGGVVPASGFPKPTYRIYPQADEVINVLSNTKNQFMWFDIETDYEEQNMQCFAFSFDGQTIWVVPVLDYTYQWAYSNLHHIMRALSIAVYDNTLVAHNGAAFDFFVLGYKYRMPVRRVYDTMIAMHRCYPDIEKSLGHGTSLWTWERFHKDEDSRGYMSHSQMMARMAYCGKDVYTMFLIHKAIEKHSKSVVGLSDSIQVAMDAIKPYLIMSLQGIRFDPEKIITAAKECDALMEQYERIVRILIGDKALAEMRAQIKGKPKMVCGSNTQLCYYFYQMLGYPIVWRSPETGKPSLGKKVMYKLALKHEDNPVIQFILAYRTIAKEFGTYKFIPWLLDDGKTHGRNSVLEVDNAEHLFGKENKSSGQGLLPISTDVKDSTFHTET